MVAQLLDAGADITLQNENDETALEVAVDSCRDMILGNNHVIYHMISCDPLLLS